jgi:excinuclease ABC subunit B
MKVGEKKGKYRSKVVSQGDLEKQILTLEKEMFVQAKNLAFEDAANLRDQIEELREQFVRS